MRTTDRIMPQQTSTNKGADQDPSALTTQQLQRENFWLREVLESEQARLEMRMDQADKAVGLLQAFADRTPTTMDVQNMVVGLREVVFAKFDGIKEQFVQAEAQAEKAARDVKSAVDAAFAAAKEAASERDKSNALSITKSEMGFTKQIDGLIEVIKTTAKNVDDKISDMKERLTIIESKTSVSDPSTAVNLAKMDVAIQRLNSTTDSSLGKSAGMASLWSLIIGGGMFLFGLVGFVITLFKFVR